MEENRDDKDFKEAVEKVINEREERKKEYVVDENAGFFPKLTEKKNLAKEAPSPVKKNKMKYVDAVLVIIAVGVVLTWVAWPSIMTGETEPVIVYPANVVLYSFDDGNNNGLTYINGGSGWPIVIEIQPDSVGVSFELKNTGDEDAMDVSCFIKCCDQDGTILFAKLFTFGDIWADTPPGKISISAIGSYRVPISNETLYVTHSIDVRWSPQGVNTYVRLTEV